MHTKILLIFIFRWREVCSELTYILIRGHISNNEFYCKYITTEQLRYFFTFVDI